MTSGFAGSSSRLVSLGDIVERHVERCGDDHGFEKFVGVDHLDTDELDLVRAANIDNEPLPPTFRFIFRAGMVLFPTRRPSLRKCAVASFDGLTGEKVLVLKPKAPEVVAPGFLPYLLESDSVKRHAETIAIGSITPHFRWNDLAAHEVRIPSPREQFAIVRRLDAMRAVRARYREAVAQAAVTSIAYRDALVSKFMHRNELMVRLGEVLACPPESGYSAPECDEDTGRYVLSLAALGPSGYVPGHLKPIHQTTLSDDASLRRGDLLLSRSNTRERVGYVGLFDEDRRDVSFPDTMMRLQVRPERTTPAFLELVLQCTPLRKVLQSIAAGTSASMKKINKQNLVSVAVPMPPLREQAATLAAWRAFAGAVNVLIVRRDETIRLYSCMREAALSEMDKET